MSASRHIVRVRKYTIPSGRRSGGVMLAGLSGVGLALLRPSVGGRGTVALLAVTALIAGISGLWSP